MLVARWVGRGRGLRLGVEDVNGASPWAVIAVAVATVGCGAVIIVRRTTQDGRVNIVHGRCILCVSAAQIPLAFQCCVARVVAFLSRGSKGWQMPAGDECGYGGQPIAT